ncbi:hypothetical protein ADUPG1_009259 [Aduncisulcus paluster]|uniref:Uncharacterized protein n=1 Tax=Aduncisulcus paluster TaxID=2918883 RepID=A0ABQ5KV05_9EUKA|nr:hypothetical protein ADUPG1_009259 [Aduncisulcus paluster]|eukprot:gnl/Carplike_NY0171/1433_a1950_987.p1 GENE.gnl/Carplike_NY0171/1433_a1950_987~~gnl/Carplike_NY0171/1433_a1950_987.p1  ORF type:complete len:283 (-),score=60.91 gnl/Carplike_NY0171/1433_a1950_987:102-950(-)
MSSRTGHDLSSFKYEGSTSYSHNPSRQLALKHLFAGNPDTIFHGVAEPFRPSHKQVPRPIPAPDTDSIHTSRIVGYRPTPTDAAGMTTTQRNREHKFKKLPEKSDYSDVTRPTGKRHFDKGTRNPVVQGEVPAPPPDRSRYHLNTTSRTYDIACTTTGAALSGKARDVRHLQRTSMNSREEAAFRPCRRPASASGSTYGGEHKSFFKQSDRFYSPATVEGDRGKQQHGRPSSSLLAKRPGAYVPPQRVSTVVDSQRKEEMVRTKNLYELIKAKSSKSVERLW